MRPLRTVLLFEQVFLLRSGSLSDNYERSLAQIFTVSQLQFVPQHNDISVFSLEIPKLGILLSLKEKNIAKERQQSITKLMEAALQQQCHPINVTKPSHFFLH